MANQYTKIAIGDMGTQLFWWNEASDYEEATVTSSTFASMKDSLYTKAGNVYTKVPASATYDSSATYYTKTVGRFEYALPVTAGAEFGGDAESFDAPETDLDYTPKIGGRRSDNDISYTINYTSEKYQRILDISDMTETNYYMEVQADGSAFVFGGTSVSPTKTAGDVTQLNWTIVPSVVVWVDDIDGMNAKCEANVTSINAEMVNSDHQIAVDTDSIPTIRQEYYTSKNLAE